MSLFLQLPPLDRIVVLLLFRLSSPGRPQVLHDAEKRKSKKPLQPHEQPDAKIARGPQKLTRAGIKVSLIELTSCEFPGKLARPELKTIE